MENLPLSSLFFFKDIEVMVEERRSPPDSCNLEDSRGPRLSPSSWRCCKVSLSATCTDFPRDCGMPVSSCWACAAVWPLSKGQASGEGKDTKGMQGSFPCTDGDFWGGDWANHSGKMVLWWPKHPSPPSYRGICWLEFSVEDAHAVTTGTGWTAWTALHCPCK